jgi:hypothetical protein
MSYFSMNFQILAFCLLFLVGQNSDSIYAESIEQENSSAPMEKFRSPSNSKIHPILIQWQLSDNPNEFAKENNLSYTENKVGVYIYLENVESRSKIPSEINVKAFDEKIAFVYVNSKQLDKLEELDFIERVTPPDLARTSIPKVEISKSPTLEENQNDYLLWPVIGAIIFITIVIFIKKRNSKDLN